MRTHPWSGLSFAADALTGFVAQRQRLVSERKGGCRSVACGGRRRWARMTRRWRALALAVSLPLSQLLRWGR